MTYGLPESVEVGGVEYAVNTDFRLILGIFEALNDMELLEQERIGIALLLFYQSFNDMPVEMYPEAARKMFWFINGGTEEDPDAARKPTLVDWKKDYPLIIAPVNHVLGREIRSDPHVHWWTFLSAYMEISGDCTFAQVVRIRSQQAKGKALDKSDREWYRQNRFLVDRPTEFTSAEMDQLRKWGGG